MTTTATVSVFRFTLALLCSLSLFIFTHSLRNNILNRRDWIQATNAASFGILTTPQFISAASNEGKATPYLMKEHSNAGVTAPQAGRFYFPTLTPPFLNRATYRYSLGRNAWAFEQLLTFANVTATIRTNVILLDSGGLWVHSPQWPTGEFMKLLDDLEHPVKHVVLPVNALEHKAPMKDFCRRFPDASVWISPGQYGLFGTCGTKFTQETSRNMGYRVDGILGDSNHMPPWMDEFDIATLYVELPENAGPVSEVAFCHRPTNTLIATDAVVFIQDGPAPEIFSTYFDESATKGAQFWPKTVLQSVFLPLRTDTSGNYPGYEALRGRLVRAPILRAFADARAPEAVREWVTTISSTFKFDRILTSHFASPIAAMPIDFKDAFGYLYDTVVDDKLPPIACRDWQLLESLNKGIESNKLGAPVMFDYTQGCR